MCGLKETNNHSTTSKIKPITVYSSFLLFSPLELSFFVVLSSRHRTKLDRPFPVQIKFMPQMIVLSLDLSYCIPHLIVLQYNSLDFPVYYVHASPKPIGNFKKMFDKNSGE